MRSHNGMSWLGWVLWILAFLGVLAVPAMATANPLGLSDEVTEAHEDAALRIDLYVMAMLTPPVRRDVITAIPFFAKSDRTPKPMATFAGFEHLSESLSTPDESFATPEDHIGLIALAQWRGVEALEGAVNRRINLDDTYVSDEPHLYLNALSYSQKHAPDRGPFTVAFGTAVGVGLMLCLANAKVLTTRRW